MFSLFLARQSRCLICIPCATISHFSRLQNLLFKGKIILSTSIITKWVSRLWFVIEITPIFVIYCQAFEILFKPSCVFTKKINKIEIISRRRIQRWQFKIHISPQINCLTLSSWHFHLWYFLQLTYIRYVDYFSS